MPFLQFYAFHVGLLTKTCIFNTVTAYLCECNWLTLNRVETYFMTVIDSEFSLKMGAVHRLEPRFDRHPLLE